MPHVGGSAGDDLASSDEIKVFKDEGEEENRSSENLTDLKSSLVTEGEEGKGTLPPTPSYSASKNVPLVRSDSASTQAKAFEPLPPPAPIGYVVSPYPHPNGTLGAVSMMDIQHGGIKYLTNAAEKNYHFSLRELAQDLLTSDQANKVTMVPPTHPGSPLPFMMYNSETFAQPPPAHMGIPPVHIDPKTGIPRPPMYPLAAPGQYPHTVFSPDFTHQLQWHSPSMYPMTSGGFRGTYPAGLPRFSPPTLIPPHPGIPSHPGIPHHALLAPVPKQELVHHIHGNNRHFSDHQNDHKIAKVVECISSGNNSSNNSQQHNLRADKKLPHIKKPLNAFMLYMKEMRAKVVAECTLKESAAINQILGRRWHSLSREEQAKYYEMARKERQLHMQLYPGWSARDNYAQQAKKKKRKRDKAQDGEASNPKKCRARFGLDQQSSWCKPCRRKKKCIRYLDGADNAGESEDNMGSAGSVEAPTPDSKSGIDSDSEPLTMSSELSLSSPQCPSEIDRKPKLEDLGVCSHPSDASPASHCHPLSVHHLTQPHCNSSVLHSEQCETDSSVAIPQLPTPPSTDSSTTAAPPLLTVT